MVFSFGAPLAVSAGSDSEKQAFQVLETSIDAISQGKSYRYELKSYERIQGELKYDRIKFSLHTEPYKVNLNCLEKPHKGVVILYEEGKNNGQARVNPGLFIPTVKLNPFGNKMRKGNHHSVLEAGFNIIQEQLAVHLERNKENPESFTVQHEGDIDFNGIECEKVVLENKDFHFTEYEVRKGESLFSISHSKNISEFLIRQINSNFSNWEKDVKPGDVISIPSSYSRKTVLYIDKSNNHPIYQEMHDNNGIFEKYIFLKLEVNPDLGTEDFSL